MTTKVIVSGMGLVSPLGENAASSWNALCPEQKKQPSTSFALGKRSDKSGLLRAEEMARSATAEALMQAGLWDGGLVGIDPERVECTVSASKPLFQGDAPYPPDILNSDVCHRFGLKGENRNIIAACATGA